MIKDCKKNAKKFEKQRAAKGVMLRLMKANRQEGTDEHTRISNEDFDLMQDETNNKSKLYKLEKELNQSQGVVKCSKEAINGIEKALFYWNSKKESLLEKGIRDIERGEY